MLKSRNVYVAAWFKANGNSLHDDSIGRWNYGIQDGPLYKGLAFYARPEYSSDWFANYIIEKATRSIYSRASTSFDKWKHPAAVAAYRSSGEVYKDQENNRYVYKSPRGKTLYANDLDELNYMATMNYVFVDKPATASYYKHAAAMRVWAGGVDLARETGSLPDHALEGVRVVGDIERSYQRSALGTLDSCNGVGDYKSQWMKAAVQSGSGAPIYRGGQPLYGKDAERAIDVGASLDMVDMVLLVEGVRPRLKPITPVAPATATDFGPRSLAQRSGRPVAQSPDMSSLYGVGAEPYGPRRLELLGKYLDKRGVDLVIDPNAVGGRFNYLTPTGRPRFVVGPDARAEVVWHELGHFIQWRRVGGTEAYRALPREFGNHVPEQSVFDLLQQPTRWERLSPGYRVRSVEYIELDWGGMGR